MTLFKGLLLLTSLNHQKEPCTEFKQGTANWTDCMACHISSKCCPECAVCKETRQE